MEFSNDIILSSNYLQTASTKIADLKRRTSELKTELESMYESLTTALDTPAGHQVEYVAKDVLLQPVEDLSSALEYVSNVLEEITSSDYYKKVFDKYDELNENVKGS